MSETAIVERPANLGGMLDVDSNRQAQEVQASVILAKRFPREMDTVRKEILSACSYPSLAEKAQYAYPKGNTEVTGVSIRLAEALASSFGNLDFGWTELERRPAMGSIAGESTIQAYCWDMQTNVRSKRVFTVRHWRNTKKGGYAINDEREIYEMNANQAARRLRACILERIPKHVQEEALKKCEDTLKENLGPLNDRVEKMIAAFAKFDVNVAMIEKRLGHKVEATNATEIVALLKVYNSIKDGYGSVADFFEVVPSVDNNINAQTPQPQQPETKSIKTQIKNHAPQTPEQAAQRKAESSQPVAQQSPAEKPKTLSRPHLIQSICESGRSLGLGMDGLREKFKILVGKEPGDCTPEELESMLFILNKEIEDAKPK